MPRPAKSEVQLLEPDWPLPAGVHAFVTTRLGGVSVAPYASLNLGLHVGDDPASVKRNRELLLQELESRTGLKNLSVQWIQQVHGTTVHEVSAATLNSVPEADAIHCRVPGVVCVVLTADCLPVMFTSGDGREVAVAHAGWRGLLDGVLEQTVARFSDGSASSAWLGPAIGPCHFEVGAEVREAFLRAARAEEEAATRAAFVPADHEGKWYGDLYALARVRLQRVGVSEVHGSARCTVCDQQHWYSYRGEARTGRFATLIVSRPCKRNSREHC